jgi:leucyl aminopeptidase
MKSHDALAVASLFSIALATSQAMAGALPSYDATHASERSALGVAQDPLAAVFIVTSRSTYDGGVHAITRNPVDRRDSLGKALVVSEIRAQQLSDVSRLIHEREKRCGGFFAFRSLAEADQFIRADRSLQAAQTVFLASYTLDNQTTVNPWLPQVAESNIYNTINTLSGYRNRYYTSNYGKNSAEWIRTTWQGLAGSRTDVSSELFACATCSTQPSVILTVQGNELPNEIVVLGAHLDSINSSAGGSTEQVAPGADDDASGIATLTEVIRVALASGWKPKRTVKFMGYAAEEVGLRGSNAIATSFQSSGNNVVGVLQLDMTNYKTGTGVDMQLITDYSNTDLKTFLTTLFDAYMAPMGLTRGTYTCGYGCSDHASWTSAGYPSAMMFEGGTSTGSYFPYIHSANDTLANMGESAVHSAKFAKFGLAFLGELAKTNGTVPPTNTPPVANFSVVTSGLTANFTDSSTDSNGSIASRSWNFGDGSTSTATNPSRTYAAAGTYNVTLTVTDNEGATNSKTAAVTVSTSGNVLQNGVPVTGLSAATGTSLNYTMVVPAGSQNLTFTMSGGTGDADMYVQVGVAPTDSSYACRPYKSGNAETCTFATPTAGTYYVRIKAYSTFSGVQLVGNYTQCADCGSGPLTYTNGTDFAITDNATVDSPITVSGRTGNAPSNASISVTILHTYKGDLKVDLVAPDGTLYNIHNRTGSSTDNVIGTFSKNLSTEALNGTWKLRVNDNAAGDVGKIDSWSITF